MHATASFATDVDQKNLFLDEFDPLIRRLGWCPSPLSTFGIVLKFLESVVEQFQFPWKIFAPDIFCSKLAFVVSWA